MLGKLGKLCLTASALAAQTPVMTIMALLEPTGHAVAHHETPITGRASSKSQPSRAAEPAAAWPTHWSTGQSASPVL